MKSKIWSFVIAATFLSALVMSGPLAAQDKQANNPKHHHYKLIDVGTFGGPSGLYSHPSSVDMNKRGMATGMADTAIQDPYAPNCFYDCWIDHAFMSVDSVTTDLGTLPGGLSSFPVGINDRGLIVGQSQNATIDPLTAVPELRGVVWQNGQILDLGTLGGNASNALAINDRGQVAGAATNATPDPFANAPQSSCQVLPTTGGCSSFTFAYNAVFSDSTTETHAVVWQGDSLRDLGTLGGPDSAALLNNERGEVVGFSNLSFVANPSTGVPTVDPFLWNPKDGKMVDLGSLGGTFGAPFFMNNLGQVIGVSNLPGDAIVHPFLWSKAKGMTDLGSLGGTYGHANWINDKSEIVGYSDLAGGQTGHAFLWRKGVITDLGTLGTDPASEAMSINSHSQIVGGTFVFNGPDLRGFLWENGGPLVDLETLVIPGSGLTVNGSNEINERGEITAGGLLPNGDTHPILLIPCDENHAGVEGCDYSLVDATEVSQNTLRRDLPKESQRPSELRSNRFHIPGLNIVRIAASGNFAETHTCGSTLASRAYCSINITFSPGATGVLTDTLSLTDNGPGSPQDVTLSGTGSSGNGSSGTLNGTCVRGGRRGCSVSSDVTDCPPGQRAKMPKYDTACTGHEGGIRIDGASFCGGGGYCEVTP